MNTAVAIAASPKRMMQVSTRLRLLLTLCVALSMGASGAEPKTQVMFFFDTEDYTCDRSNDAIRDIANMLSSEGVKGNFNIAGFLALRLVELRRFDVIESLKGHVIGTQSLYHSRHPNIGELGDDPDYARSYRRTMLEEAKGIGMLDAALGENRTVFHCPPGNSFSLAACDVYTDLGLSICAAYGFYGGMTRNYSGMVSRPGKEKLGLWYYNQYHVPYCLAFHLESMLPRDGKPCPNFKKTLDDLAQYDYAGLYMHPHMAVKTKHWDSPNYRKENLVKWREWIQVEDRNPAETAVYYERFRAFIRAVKADPRFEISDLGNLQKSFKPRVMMTPIDVSAVRKALLADFNCIREPASWSVADAFQGVVRFLRGEPSYTPGKVRGFLSRPKGVSKPTEVSLVDLRAAAAKLDLDAFIPAEIAVGAKMIGPADFLFAALEALKTGKETVTAVPREQLGSFKEVPGLEKMNLGGTWIYMDTYKDAYNSERLRLQLWTLRLE